MNQVDVIVGMFLAYYWTGLDMVSFHIKSPRYHQPSYISGGFWRKFISGATWPVVAKLNQELWWYSVCFLSLASVAVAYHSVLSGLLSSTATTITLVLMRLVPVIQLLVVVPCMLISSLLWKFIAEPMGGRMPNS